MTRLRVTSGASLVAAGTLKKQESCYEGYGREQTGKMKGNGHKHENSCHLSPLPPVALNVRDSHSTRATHFKTNCKYLACCLSQVAAFCLTGFPPLILETTKTVGTYFQLCNLKREEVQSTAF